MPSESEWEFACRAGFDEENHRYSVQNAGSMTIDKSMANYGNPMDGETVPVRRYAPNRWGLWQMHGNVWEWCVDPKISNYTHKNYTHKVVGSFKTLIENLENNPPQPHPIIAVPDHTYTVGPSRVLRGGSWYDRGDFLRCARRFGRAPVDRYRSVGFRLCWGESSTTIIPPLERQLEFPTGFPLSVGEGETQGGRFRPTGVSPSPPVALPARALAWTSGTAPNHSSVAPVLDRFAASNR